MKKFFKISVLLIALVTGAIYFFIGSIEKADFYEMGDDKIPSVKFVLGEKRKITGSAYRSENDRLSRTFQYSTDPNDQTQAANDMEKYIRYLQDNDGFISSGSSVSLNSSNNQPYTSMRGMSFSKESLDAGKIITININYDSNGYKLDIVKRNGSLVKNPN